MPSIRSISEICNKPKRSRSINVAGGEVSGLWISCQQESFPELPQRLNGNFPTTFPITLPFSSTRQP